MTVPYASEEMYAMDLVARWHAASPGVWAWLSLDGVTVNDAIAARARVIEIDGDPLAGRHLAIDAPDWPVDRTGGHTFMGRMTIDVGYFAPTVAGDTWPEIQRRGWNDLGLMRRVIRDGFRAQPSLQLRGIRVVGSPTLFDLSEALSNYIGFELQIALDVQLS